MKQLHLKEAAKSVFFEDDLEKRMRGIKRCGFTMDYAAAAVSDNSLERKTDVLHQYRFSERKTVLFMFRPIVSSMSIFDAL